MSEPAGLLDTSVFIARAVDRPLGELPSRVTASVVTIGELELGVLSAADAASRTRRGDTLALAKTVEPVPIGESIMGAWDRLVVDCRTAGVQRTVELFDALIAATAVDLGLPVVAQHDDYDQMASAHRALHGGKVQQADARMELATRCHDRWHQAAGMAPGSHTGGRHAPSPSRGAASGLRLVGFPPARVRNRRCPLRHRRHIGARWSSPLGSSRVEFGRRLGEVDLHLLLQGRKHSAQRKLGLRCAFVERRWRSFRCSASKPMTRQAVDLLLVVGKTISYSNVPELRERLALVRVGAHRRGTSSA